jgi:superfamily II DNA or RNA helicase
MNDTTIPRLPTLWDHQQEAVAGTISNLATDDRCKVTMACATGKTRVGPSIAIARGARTVIIYLPSLALIRQTLPEWIAAPFPAPLRYLCVCSDSSVADQSDEVVVTEDDIEREFGRSVVTTRSEVVQEFLADDADAVTVVFSTYQSSDVVRDGMPDGFTFDMGFFDEAHRTAGRDGMFSAPLHDAHTPMAKRVFMTATPKHLSYRGRKAGDEAAVVYSMDDEKLYGRTAYNLPIREAIKRGIIADYKVLVSVIDDQRIKRDALKGQIGSDGKPVDAEAMAHAIAIRDAMDQFGVSKVVTFHNSVAEAEEFATHPAIAAELKTSTFHVNGNQAASVRSEILGQFAEATDGVVTNARCLTEGVDVPAIDMVAFLHPKKSHIDIIQAIGRALRQNGDSGKTHGYVLLPLYVPEIGNGGLDRALKEFGYDTIWQVIEALRVQDEVVNAAIQEATRARRTGDAPKLDFIEITGPAVHLALLRNSISTRCIEALMAPWDEMYGVLVRYKEETGRANPPQDAVFEERNLGAWLNTQRQFRRDGKLSTERIATLDGIGVAWNPLDAKWSFMSEVYARYVKKNGESNPSWQVIVEGEKLGVWLTYQRKSRRDGKLSAERIAILDGIGIEWNPLNTQWPIMAEIYARYVKKTGVVNPPRDTTFAEGKNLGAWLNNQCQSRRDGKLSAERIAVLDGIGIEWNPLDAKWSFMSEVYARYVKKNGVANPSQTTLFEGENLGRWLNTQRQIRRDGKLSAERIAILDGLGIRWSLRAGSARGPKG